MAFGSLVLVLLAVMLFGSLFLDYEPFRMPAEELPQAEQQADKQATRFLVIYWMALLLLVMAVLALAVFDLWATVRHGVQQQKQLFQDHQEMLEAELEETEAVMGADFHPEGFEKNRRAIEVFANQAFDLGIVGRRVSPEEYFADFLAS